MVMVVEHLRIVVEHRARDGLRFDHVVHVSVAIVVMADVLLPQTGHVAHFI